MLRSQASSGSSPLPPSTAGSATSRITRSSRQHQSIHNNDIETLAHQVSLEESHSPTSPARGISIIDKSPSLSNGRPFEGHSSSTSPATADATGKMLSGGNVTSPANEAVYMGQQSYQRYNEHDAALMGGNRSIGAPTPTSTSSYGGMKEDGSFMASFAGRRESDFGGAGTDEDAYGGGLYDSNAVGEADLQDNPGSPDYGGGDGDDGLDVGEGGSGSMGGLDSREALRMKSEGEGNDQTPMWSETKTKAGKERKRLPLACIMCRRKKIRCSGEKPACKHCLRSRIPCVYKQTARKTAPRTDYMAMLDRRLKRMEERLLKNVPKEEISTILASTGRSVVKPSANPAGRKRSAEVAFDDEVESWSRQQGNSGKHRNLGGADEMNAELQNRIAAPADSDDGSHALPSKEIQEHLAEVFFDYIYGQPYYLLHKPSFMRRLRSGTAPPVLVLSICAVSARFSSHPAVVHTPPFLAGEKFASEARRQLLKNFDTPNITNLTVCVILGLHEFGTCHGGRSWTFGGMATRMAHALQLHKESEHDPMGKVHPMMRPDYFHEGGLPGCMSFTDKEIRRRCMWACFVMDRFNSSGTERPCIINENEVEIQLPVHDQNIHLDSPATTEQLDGGVKDSSDAPEEEKIKKASENMGIGAYMIRAVAMYGRVVKYLNQGGREKDAREMWDPESHFSELSSEIQDFIDDLPEKFQYTPENLEAHAAEKQLGQFVFLHVAFYQIKLFLHRSALTTPSTPNGQPTMPTDFLSRATEVAIDAATKIAVILQESQERGARVVAPFTGYCAFNASLVHLVRMFCPQKRVQIEAKKHMETCLRFLLQLKQYWGLFCSITDNLKMLYRRFQDAVAGGGPLVGGHQEASRMLQYGDWFSKYPAGPSTSDFEDSTTRSHHSSEGIRSPSVGDDPALSHRPDLQTADEFFARLGPRQHKPTPLYQRRPPTHGSSPNIHSKSPASIYRKSPTVQKSPQHNPIQNTSQPSPNAVSTPAMIQTPVNMPLKPETQMPSHGQGHGSQININQQPSYSSGSFSQQDANQLSSPISAGIGSMSTSNQFSNYAQPLPQGSQINNAQSSFERTQPVSQQHQQSYLYDSYPAGSDASLMAALSTNLWQGFDQPINTVADLNTFPDQNSSAWFMPFNSYPPGFEPGAMGTVGMMGSGNGGGAGMTSEDITGRAGGIRTRVGPGEVGDGDVSHIMTVGSGQVVPGGLPSPPTYHSRGGQ